MGRDMDISYGLKPKTFSHFYDWSYASQKNISAVILRLDCIIKQQHKPRGENCFWRCTHIELFLKDKSGLHCPKSTILPQWSNFLVQTTKNPDIVCSIKTSILDKHLMKHLRCCFLFSTWTTSVPWKIIGLWCLWLCLPCGFFLIMKLQIQLVVHSSASGHK